VSSRYVQMPNGSYLEWPEGVSAAEFKAKAAKIGTAPKQTEMNPNDRLWSGTQSFSAYHPKTGLAGIEEKLGDWRQRLSEFAARGQGKGVGDFMASAPLGALRVAKGTSEIPQGKIWEGTKNVLGGAAEAATMPSMFFAPEATSAASKLLPSTEKAGKLLESVEQAAGHVPLDLKGPGKAAMEIVENAKSGGTRPKVIADFMRRISDQTRPPLTYAEARKFYENAISKFAPDIHGNPLKGKPRYMLAKFAKSLDQAIQGAAEKVGKGQEYAEAMRKYHSASKFESAAKAAKSKAGRMAGAAAVGAAGAAGAKTAYDWLRK
jgi:hypothetical protein